MEIIIIISLLIIILLMVWKEIKIQYKKSEHPETTVHYSNNSQIIGKSKTQLSKLLPKSLLENQESETEFDPSNLDIEFDINESITDQIVMGEPEKDSGSQLNFLEEEEEWDKYRIISQDHALAQGVTYDELSKVEMLLRYDLLESSEKETVIPTVQKIYGTELHTLLENSIENASQKIAELLDRSINT